MEEILSLKFLGIGSKAIRTRSSTDEGIIHGILLQNANKELAVFISVISFKQNNNKKGENLGVIGGFTLEDLKEHLENLKKETWVPLGLIKIDLGEKAVKNFLKDGKKPFTLINLIKDVESEKLNYMKRSLVNNYQSYII